MWRHLCTPGNSCVLDDNNMSKLYRLGFTDSTKVEGGVTITPLDTNPLKIICHFHLEGNALRENNCRLTLHVSFLLSFPLIYDPFVKSPLLSMNPSYAYAGVNRQVDFAYHSRYQFSIDSTQGL